MGQREGQAAKSLPVNDDAARIFVKSAQIPSSQFIVNNDKLSENKAEMRNSPAQSSAGECPRDLNCFCRVLFLKGMTNGI